MSVHAMNSRLSSEVVSTKVVVSLSMVEVVVSSSTVVEAAEIVSY